MTDNPFSGPAWDELVSMAENELAPKMSASAAVMSLVPTKGADVKFALEIGYAIMLNKPIIAVVHPGSDVPPKLRDVADEIIEIDLSRPDSREQLSRRMSQIDLEGLAKKYEAENAERKRSSPG